MNMLRASSERKPQRAHPLAARPPPRLLPICRLGVPTCPLADSVPAQVAPTDLLACPFLSTGWPELPAYDDDDDSEDDGWPSRK